VTWDHGRVEELLAARALDGLDPEEAALAERALIEHVPGCPRCRETLDSFRTLTGDLALLAEPVAPPDTLEARIGRSIRRRRRRTLRGAGWASVAAAVVAVGIVGWNLSLTSRLSDTEETQSWLVTALSSIGHPEGSVVPLTGPGSGRASMVYVQGEESMYVIATRLPEPEGTYTVWLVGDGRTWSPGSMEMHGDVGFLFVRTDPERWRLVMITDEAREDLPAPRSSPVVSATMD
jgi:anti-sigma factor RsiW